MFVLRGVAMPGSRVFPLTGNGGLATIVLTRAFGGLDAQKSQLKLFLNQDREICIVMSMTLGTTRSIPKR